MNHNVFGRKLSRSKNERRRLFANLVRSLVLHGSIVTTETKAKAIKPMVDKCITMAKKGTDASYRNLLKTVCDARVAKQLVKDAKDRFRARSSGYTRIVKLGKRSGDATEVVLLSFVDEVVPVEVVQQKETKSEPADKKGKEKKSGKPAKSKDKKTK